MDYNQERHIKNFILTIIGGTVIWNFVQDYTKKSLIRPILRHYGLATASDGSAVTAGTSAIRFKSIMAMLLAVEVVESSGLCLV